MKITQEMKDAWIQTYTGKMVRIFDFDESQVCIEDIAHALSRQCRFGGHCRPFYSVAEHSVRVYNLMTSMYNSLGTINCYTKFFALMHDAAEAYLGDMPRPIKKVCPWYGEIEENVMQVILLEFKIEHYSDVNKFVDRDLVQLADDILLVTERRDLMTLTNENWGMARTVLPLKNTIIPYCPDEAKRLFLDIFYSREISNIHGAKDSVLFKSLYK